MRAIRYTLNPGETLNAVIKKLNRFDITKNELDLLIEEFKLINEERNFKPGESCLIPIHQKFWKFL